MRGRYQITICSTIPVTPIFMLLLQRKEIIPLIESRMPDISDLFEQARGWKICTLDQVQLVFDLTMIGHKSELSTSRPRFLWDGHLPPIIFIVASTNFILDPIAMGELAVFQAEEMLPKFVMEPYRAGSGHYTIMRIFPLK